MDINQKLANEMGIDLWNLYGLSFSGFWDTIVEVHDFETRQKNVIEIIDNIMTHHGKKTLLHYVCDLAKVEHGIQELQPWLRDHVVHAMLSFVLGAYINEKFLNPINNFKVDSFPWKIAGLFHDVAYPVEIAHNIARPLADKMNQIADTIGIKTKKVSVKTVPVNFEALTNGKNALDLIQEQIDSWDLSIDAKTEYEHSINSDSICHGMLSALSVLWTIDLMYQRYNPKRLHQDIRGEFSSWDQTYFEEDVVPACAAIFLHNLPSVCFKAKKINRHKAPLAFLLRLADSLQDWDRPSKDNPSGHPASKYDIYLEDDSLKLSINLPEEHKDKIRNEIYSSLEAADVLVV